MDQNIINKLENIIKNHNKNIYYEYLKILNLYKFLIENIQEFLLDDQLEIITFFHEKMMSNNFNIFDILNKKESIIFITNKTKEKNFKLAVDYYRNREILKLDAFQSIEAIQKNGFYEASLINFLKRNSTIISNVFDFNKEMFQEKLEGFSSEKEFFDIYSDAYCDIISIRKNFFKDFSPSLLSSFGLTIRFCELGQIGFKKDTIILNENEALITKGISLGQYKVLTNDVNYLTIHIKDKFLKDFNIQKINCSIKKIPWKIDKQSSQFFKKLSLLENNKILVLNFLTNIILELLEEEKRLKFKILSEDNLIKITKYIDDNLENTNLSINQLKSVFGYNKNALLQLFKNNFELCPSKYIINKKLEYASVLLLETKLSVTEISSKLNFSNSSKFSLSFKNKFLYTPLQFRKKYTGGF
ncbi:MAG: helix-turn-helix transcriptional regulator [Cetobacterium sp.]